MCEIDEKLVEAQAELCKSLAHPLRLKILSILSTGSKNVTDIVNTLGEPQPLVSRHLLFLKEKGVVKAERKGTNIYYSLAHPELQEACKIIQQVLRKILAEKASIATQ